MNKKLIIFDFDGVLVETSEIGYTLHTEANPHLPREYFAEFSQGNFLENMDRAIAEDNYQVQENWDDLYLQRLLKQSSHDTINDLVMILSPDSVLVIVSSTNAAYIDEFLKKEDLRKYFSDILGSETHSNKTLKIRRLLEEYAVAPEDSIFITDTLGDIREGNACDVHSIGVLWGTHDKETLLKGEPFAIVDSIPELESEIARYFKMRDTAA